VGCAYYITQRRKGKMLEQESGIVRGLEEEEAEKVVAEEGGIVWKLWFKITGEVEKLPKSATKVAEEVLEDHLEELWVNSLGTFYRHAGGGRGFYWVQTLELLRNES